MPTTTIDRAHRLERAMTVLARRTNLSRFHHAVSRAAGTDVDRATYLVLRRLQLGGPTRITDLATQLGVEPSTVSRHVARLERRGLLERSTDPSDGRAARISITSAGADIVGHLEDERHRILSETLGSWSDADLDRFIDLLERYTNDITATLERLP